MSSNTVYKVVKKHKVSPTETVEKEILDDFGINREVVTLDVDIEIPKDFDVLYITGESGSGKSTILNEIEDVTTYNVREFRSTMLIEMGDDSGETLGILNMFGLGDASLFTLYPDQLSDSQRKRAEIVRMVLDGNNPIVIDEFLSTLDRVTAKSIAYNVQKNFRRMGLTLIVATAHDDLSGYLKSDVVVRGTSFPSKFTVEKANVGDYVGNPVAGGLSVIEVDKVAYRNEPLGEIHYKGKYSGGKQVYFFAYLGERVVGLLVTNNLMSSKTRRISRVVVHPSFRGTGIAQRLIKHCVYNTLGKVDTLAAMAKYNPVFEKAGMTRVEDVVTKSPSGFKASLFRHNFDLVRWGDLDYCVSASEDRSFREEISKYASHTNNLIQPGGAKLSKEERGAYILGDAKTCGRIVWALREKTMAKYESKGMEGGAHE